MASQRTDTAHDAADAAAAARNTATELRAAAAAHVAAPSFLAFKTRDAVSKAVTALASAGENDAAADALAAALLAVEDAVAAAVARDVVDDSVFARDSGLPLLLIATYARVAVASEHAASRLLRRWVATGLFVISASLVAELAILAPHTTKRLGIAAACLPAPYASAYAAEMCVAVGERGSTSQHAEQLAILCGIDPKLDVTAIETWRSVLYRDVLLSRQIPFAGARVLLRALNNPNIVPKSLTLVENITIFTQQWADRNFVAWNSDTVLRYVTFLVVASLNLLRTSTNNSTQTEDAAHIRHLQRVLTPIIIPGVSRYFHHPDERVRKYGMLVAQKFADIQAGAKGDSTDGAFVLDFGKDFRQDPTIVELEQIACVDENTKENSKNEDVDVDEKMFSASVIETLVRIGNVQPESDIFNDLLAPFIQAETGVVAIRRKRFQQNMARPNSIGAVASTKQRVDGDDEDSIMVSDSDDEDNDLNPINTNGSRRISAHSKRRTADSILDEKSAMDKKRGGKIPVYLQDCIKYFKSEDVDELELALQHTAHVIRHTQEDVDYYARQLFQQVAQLRDNYELNDFDKLRLDILEELIVSRPRKSAMVACDLIFTKNIALSHRLDMFVVLTRAFCRLAGMNDMLATAVNANMIANVPTSTGALSQDQMLANKFGKMKPFDATSSKLVSPVIELTYDEKKLKIERLVADKRGKMRENFGSVVMSMIIALVDRLETDPNAQAIFTSKLADGATLLTKLVSTLSILTVCARSELQIIQIAERVLSFLTQMVMIVTNNSQESAEKSQSDQVEVEGYELSTSTTLRESIRNALTTVLSIQAVGSKYGNIVNQFKIAADPNRFQILS